MAYIFSFDETKLPVTPSSLKIKINNQNKTVNLINDGEVNILRTPGLSDISFDFLVPRHERHFADELREVSFYLDMLEEHKVNSDVFQFIVYRDEGFKTNMTVTLEDYELTEDTENNSDLMVSVNLKQYRDYGTKEIKLKGNGTGNKKPSKKKPSKSNKKKTVSYTVKSGDTLWMISKKHLGDATQWKKIYNANKSVIESAAKKRGYKSSSNGHWIFPGTKLVISKG